MPVNGANCLWLQEQNKKAGAWRSVLTSSQALAGADQVGRVWSSRGQADRAPHHTREVGDVSSGEGKTLGSPTKEAWRGRLLAPYHGTARRTRKYGGKEEAAEACPPPQATDRPRLRVSRKARCTPGRP